MGMHKRLSTSNGAALLSVLLVVALLTWIVSYFISKTHQHIELATLQKQRVMAEIEADSLIDEVMFYHFSKSYSGEDKFQNWNYQGKPFKPNKNQSVEIQDTQGKLSLINLNKNLFSNFLLNNGFEQNEVNRLSDCLEDWQDKDDFKRINGEETDYYREQALPGPRNGRIQSLSEFSIICGFPVEMKKVQLILDNFLLYNMGSFNPIFAKKELIKGVNLAPDRRKLLMDLAKDGNQTLAQEYFGVPDAAISAMNMQLSKDIEVRVKVEHSKAIASREIVFSQNMRYKPRPILQFWHWSE